MASTIEKLIAPRVLSRYRQMGIIPGWNRERLMMLCCLVNRTPEEVGAMAGLTTGETRRCLDIDRFPPPVSLHFAIFDAAIRKKNFNEPTPPIVPLDLLEEAKDEAK